MTFGKFIAGPNGCKLQQWLWIFTYNNNILPFKCGNCFGNNFGLKYEEYMILIPFNQINFQFVLNKYQFAALC